MKRTLAWLLVMLTGLLPLNAAAASEESTAFEQNPFTGKTVSILSHSASTYAGVSNNTAYNSTIGNNDIYYTEGRHGIYLKDTWWQQVIDALGMRLLVNNSWSGSCVFMPRKGEASVGYGDRAVNLHNDHTGEEPDVIFVYLGCNDFAYYKDTFGKADAVDYSALIQDNGDGTFSYCTPQTTCEAYAIMLHKVANRYPDAEIYCMTSTARRETDYAGDSYPDAGQPTEYSVELQQIAKYFGFPVIDLEKAIPKEIEIFDKYMGDKRAHPNALGMDRITNEVLSVMLDRDVEICHVTSEDGICIACGAEHPNLQNYNGKVISILGDSISTFAGYIPTADGFNLEHLARYPQDNLLTDVNETWWMQIINRLDAKLGINDSWRGATVSGAKPVTTGTTGANACMANLIRIQNLGSNGTPDVILFYGGTNDLAHVSDVGSFDPETAPNTVDLTAQSWDNLADGYVNTILRLQYYYPDAQIVCLLPTYTASYYSDSKLAQGNEVMAAICEHYGVPYMDLRNCGITTADLPDGIHPDANGMDCITGAVLNLLQAECELDSGVHIVHSVTHELTGAESSKAYYKGVSHGKSFTATITGDNVTVTVTMDGLDITNNCYADGVVTIPEVTGDIVITAEGEEKTVYADYLLQLPDAFCAGTNLWTLLEHNKEYYTANGWGVHASGKVYSVTIPVSCGDQIWATSFRSSGANGGTMNGIRLTWFDAEGVLKSLSPKDTYAEFVENGYLTAPEEAIAVNVVMWNNSDSNELYILNREHVYESTVTAPTCTEQGYTTHACECGDSYVDSYVDAAGHSYICACVNGEYHKEICTVCGDERETAHVWAADNHCTGCGLSGVEAVLQEGVLTVFLHHLPCEEFSLIAAVYAADGRMTACKLFGSPADRTVSADLAPSEGETVCVFVLDGNFRPIMQPIFAS